MKRVTILGSAAVMLAAIAVPAQAQKFSQSLDVSERTQQDSARSQQRIDQLDEQTARLLNDYRAQIKQLDAALRYNKSLERTIEGQEEDMKRLEEDIQNIDGIRRAMQPLMEDMVAKFAELVDADIPFKLSERLDRVSRLNDVVNDTNMSAAQRYRLIVEAYQIENEYGSTISAYDGFRGEIAGEYLQVGRIALIFKTKDDSVLEIYDIKTGEFVKLNKSYLPDVKFGLRMAKEQTAPDVFFVPVRSAEVFAAAAAAPAEVAPAATESTEAAE